MGVHLDVVLDCLVHGERYLVVLVGLEEDSWDFEGWRREEGRDVVSYSMELLNF